MPSGFDYSLDYKNLDLSREPHLYGVGRGEQGVLLVEPYKAEILPHWRFKTEEVARESSEKIHAMFLSYKEQADFVGLDTARKFLEMGYTRARRYANHRSGKKYDEDGRVRPQEPDALNGEKAREDEHYKRRRKEWAERYGQTLPSPPRLFYRDQAAPSTIPEAQNLKPETYLIGAPIAW